MQTCLKKVSTPLLTEVFPTTSIGQIVQSRSKPSSTTKAKMNRSLMLASNYNTTMGEGFGTSNQTGEDYSHCSTPRRDSRLLFTSSQQVEDQSLPSALEKKIDERITHLSMFITKTYSDTILHLKSNLKRLANKSLFYEDRFKELDMRLKLADERDELNRRLISELESKVKELEYEQAQNSQSSTKNIQNLRSELKIFQQKGAKQKRVLENLEVEVADYVENKTNMKKIIRHFEEGHPQKVDQGRIVEKAVSMACSHVEGKLVDLEATLGRITGFRTMFQQLESQIKSRDYEINECKSQVKEILVQLQTALNAIVKMKEDSRKNNKEVRRNSSDSTRAPAHLTQQDAEVEDAMKNFMRFGSEDYGQVAHRVEMSKDYLNSLDAFWSRVKKTRVTKSTSGGGSSGQISKTDKSPSEAQRQPVVPPLSLPNQRSENSTELAGVPRKSDPQIEIQKQAAGTPRNQSPNNSSLEETPEKQKPEESIQVREAASPTPNSPLGPTLGHGVICQLSKPLTGVLAAPGTITPGHGQGIMGSHRSLLHNNAFTKNTSSSSLSVTFFVGEDHFLRDNHGNYILDDKGERIFVSDEEMLHAQIE